MMCFTRQRAKRVVFGHAGAKFKIQRLGPFLKPIILQFVVEELLPTSGKLANSLQTTNFEVFDRFQFGKQIVLRNKSQDPFPLGPLSWRVWSFLSWFSFMIVWHSWQ